MRTSGTRVPRAAGLAWSVFGVSVALSALAIVLAAIQPEGELLFAVTVGLLLAVPFPAIGALIASRSPGNAIGWIFCAVGLFQAFNISSTEYARYALITEPGSFPLGGFAAWVAYLSWMPSIGLLTTFLLLLFPNGRLPSLRWRWAAWSAGAGLALVLIGLGAGAATIPLRQVVMADEAVEGAFPPIAVATAVAGGLLVLAGALASAASIVVRFRRSRGEEREQLKWMAYAGSYLFAATALQFTPAAERGGWEGVLSQLLFLIGIVGVPVSAAIAILKYRLYAIDVVINKTVVYGTLAVFATIVYLAVVVGAGALVGTAGEPNVFLSILATAIVALAFQPARERARRLANRVVYGRRATPYEVLSEFSDRMGGTYASEDLLPRMARILAEGTGAARADVWLKIGSELRPEASWPPDADAPHPARIEGDDVPQLPQADRSVPVRHQGELLGALAVEKPPSEPLTPAEGKLVADLAAQAGLVLRNVRLIEELRASRQRLVAAQDEERRKLERNLHDGAQQQLVALTIKLKLAEQLADRDLPKAKEMLAQLQGDAASALDELRDLARGIYPPLLADRGLGEAIAAQARKSPLPVSVDPDGIGRYPREAEAAVYFCCLEALQNAGKYANASRAAVRLGHENGVLTFAVEDDGAGFDPATTPRGSGLQNMVDRLEALGGTIEVRSEPGRGTEVVGRVRARATEETR